MCLTLFAHDLHPKYKLILTNNRDELQARPTATADYWEENPAILAGRDLTAGGTWLGIHKMNGRLSNITNYRDFRIPLIKDAPSRGDLTTCFLKGTDNATAYLKALLPTAASYNGFNLLLRQGDELAWFSNIENQIRILNPGVYGFSNALLDTPWPKVEKGKAFMQSLLARDDWTGVGLFYLSYFILSIVLLLISILNLYS